MTPPLCGFNAFGGSKPPPYDFGVGANAHIGPNHNVPVGGCGHPPLRRILVGRGIKRRAKAFSLRRRWQPEGLTDVVVSHSDN